MSLDIRMAHPFAGFSDVRIGVSYAHI